MSEGAGKFGHITADDSRYHRNVRVYLDGDDVTDGCLEADDEEGYVVLLQGIERRDGEPFALTETRHGYVEIEWREDVICPL